jgi:ABC-type sugar transport system ATPase subunit
VGAGRTEIARIIFGTDPLESGKIVFRGKEVRPGSPRGAIDLGIGYLSEDRNNEGLLLQMSVRENITLSSLDAVRRGWFVDRDLEKQACDRFIKQLTIKTPDMNRRAEELSGGNRQKVILARWLMTNSRVLIFDEPTAGIDVGVKFEIYSLIDTLASGGMGIIVISSDLPELLGISDRIAVVSGGTVTGLLDRADATQEKIMELAMKNLSPEAGEAA